MESTGQSLSRSGYDLATDSWPIPVLPCPLLCSVVRRITIVARSYRSQRTELPLVCRVAVGSSPQRRRMTLLDFRTPPGKPARMK
jgi:hypothetical protein